MRIAVVGAGIAGVACAQGLRASGHEVVVLDRGRVPGGRMASRRFDGRYVDLGASYFTVREDGFRALVDDWEHRGLARPWTDRFHVWQDGSLQPPKIGPVRWAAPGGLRSLVADLAQGLEMHQHTHVEQVSTSLEVAGDSYDRVVLGMPGPQALPLLGRDFADETAVLERVAWDPVLVLAARWERRVWDWDGLFVHGSDVVEWVADDGSRRGDGAPVLTAHSTPSFASTRLAVPADAAPELVTAVQQLGLPAPVEVLRVQRWSVAKPVGEREELFFLGDKGIGLCGDGFGPARIETAWRSGNALAQALSS